MHIILSIYLAMVSLLGLSHKLPVTKAIKYTPTPTNSPIPIPSPTASSSATPVAMNPYKKQLIAQLTSQLNDLDIEISKWNDAIKYDNAAEKSMVDSTTEAINNGSNGQPLDPAALSAGLYGSGSFADKAQQARDEIYKLQNQRTQLLIDLANEQ